MDLVDYDSDSSDDGTDERIERKGLEKERVLPGAEEAIAGTLGGAKRKHGPGHATDQVAKSAKSKQGSSAKTTLSNAMLPPQVRGKKNVVTEDLERMGLNVKRRQK